MTCGGYSRKQISINHQGPGMPSRPRACLVPLPTTPTGSSQPRNPTGKAKRAIRTTPKPKPCCRPPRNKPARLADRRKKSPQVYIQGAAFAQRRGEGWGDRSPPSAPPAKPTPDTDRQGLASSPPPSKGLCPARGKKRRNENPFPEKPKRFRIPSTVRQLRTSRIFIDLQVILQQ